MVSDESFRWLSLLGLSVGLFVACGVLYIVIGVLTPLFVLTPLWRDKVGEQTLIMSAPTDRVLFGGSPSELLRGDPALAQLRALMLTMIAGLLLAAGIFMVALAWFGVRQGQPWALTALGVAGVAVLPYWVLVLRPYLDVGAPVGLFDVPPLMWVPAALLLPALVSGWLGLQHGTPV